MNRYQLIKAIKEKESYLCVGLDTVHSKIPKSIRTNPDAVFDFNKIIIDSTKDACVAYKINTAFYEADGPHGLRVMQQTLDYIPETHLKIADAKRGDIGNTSHQYARTFFEHMKFDAVTVAPYMGEDSIRPFLEYENKWTIVLGLTSNRGAADFELQRLASGQYLYEKVIETVARWGTKDNLMFVTGATQATALKNIRTIIPDHFLLIPGIGFQGGSLSEVSENGFNEDVGILVNASRAVIYAGEGPDFAVDSALIAQKYQREMQGYMRRYLPMLKGT